MGLWMATVTATVARTATDGALHWEGLRRELVQGIIHDDDHDCEQLRPTRWAPGRKTGWAALVLYPAHGGGCRLPLPYQKLPSD